jgi:hypothetical protein
VAHPLGDNANLLSILALCQPQRHVGIMEMPAVRLTLHGRRDLQRANFNIPSSYRSCLLSWASCIRKETSAMLYHDSIVSGTLTIWSCVVHKGVLKMQHYCFVNHNVPMELMDVLVDNIMSLIQFIPPEPAMLLLSLISQCFDHIYSICLWLGDNTFLFNKLFNHSMTQWVYSLMNITILYISLSINV